MHNNEYWFKRKRYGIGFVPVTRKGWILTLSYVGVLFFVTTVFFRGIETTGTSAEIFVYNVVLVMTTMIFLYFVFTTSPTPRWRWGKKDTDNPEEDF